MTTNKQLLDVADEMAEALRKLTDGLAKDGTALEGFTNAIAVQEKWSRIKIKKMFEKCIQANKQSITSKKPNNRCNNTSRN